MIYTFELPMYITIPRKRSDDKRIPLTLNWYRNAHYTESNKVKTLFGPIQHDLWEGQPSKIRISYRIKKRTNGRYDTMNFVSVIDKFFCDWLVNWGLLKDDDCTTVEHGRIRGTKGDKCDMCIAIVEIFDTPLEVTV